MALPLLGVHHVAILVDDLERAESFYAGVLGLAVEKRWADNAGGTRSVWLAIAGGTRLMLERATAGDAKRGPSGPGWHLLAFAIRRDERGAIEAALSAAGVVIDSRSEHSLYLRDPEGNRVALSHWPD